MQLVCQLAIEHPLLRPQLGIGDDLARLSTIPAAKVNPMRYRQRYSFHPTAPSCSWSLVGCPGCCGDGRLDREAAALNLLHDRERV